jgi:hypothetical protein
VPRRRRRISDATSTTATRRCATPGSTAASRSSSTSRSARPSSVLGPPPSSAARPAHGIHARRHGGTVRLEMLRPADRTRHLDEAVSAQYPARGYRARRGPIRSVPLGIGVEVRGDKAPHWTGRANSPGTFGHFGGAGTMMWVDPAIGHRARGTHRPAVPTTGATRRCGCGRSSPTQWLRSGRKWGHVMFQAGDRVRWVTTDDDGLPLVRYGFVGGCNGDGTKVGRDARRRPEG